MNIIFVNGRPSAGKSTALKLLKNRFNSDYKVFSYNDVDYLIDDNELVTTKSPNLQHKYDLSLQRIAKKIQTLSRKIDNAICLIEFARGEDKEHQIDFSYKRAFNFFKDINIAAEVYIKCDLEIILRRNKERVINNKVFCPSDVMKRFFFRDIPPKVDFNQIIIENGNISKTTFKKIIESKKIKIS